MIEQITVLEALQSFGGKAWRGDIVRECLVRTGESWGEACVWHSRLDNMIKLGYAHAGLGTVELTSSGIQALGKYRASLANWMGDLDDPITEQAPK